ncbi:hypothetical protein Glove_21g39 [Diversispora epigaea]|uniref:Uncharacterized protein n=1 Tax=Diversispora epigaea TaxID=1348612 RepID=A0A397JU22_9GLOM|nr:hypothetical protein Glove_21g39 [Diversispora epigaea]
MFSAFFWLRAVTARRRANMISNTNKSDQSETLYKQKDIIAIQEKLNINENTNHATILQSKTEHEPEGKTLADSYKLLLHLVGGLIPIQENLVIGGNPVLAVEWYNTATNQSNKASTDLILLKLYNLFLCLKENIMTIQKELGIVGCTNQEMAEEADKNARAYFQKFEKFHGPLEDVPSAILQKFGKMGKESLVYQRRASIIFECISSTIT